MSVTVLLLIVFVFSTGAALGFKRKLFAAAMVITNLGIVYFLVGVVSTSGVPDELVTDGDMSYIWTGFCVAVCGILMLITELWLHTRRTMPRR